LSDADCETGKTVIVRRSGCKKELEALQKGGRGSERTLAFGNQMRPQITCWRALRVLENVRIVANRE
jgi:hypothetical protein